MATTGDKDATKAEKLEQIDLTKLSLPQLQQLKMEFESELNLFQNSLQTLKTAKTKFNSSKESLEQFKENWKDKEVLVPVTKSMYVPGQLKEIDNFVIDIGTGYYVEKNLDGSKDYFKRKVEFVQEQMDKIDALGVQKYKVLNAVMDVIDLKMSQLQQQAASTAASS